MKTKLFALLILAVVTISTVGYATGSLNNGAKKNTRNAPKSAVSTPQQTPADETGMIDGAKHPELIPDHVAYSLLFRTISGNQNPEAKNRIRHYVRQMGLGKCPTCPKKAVSTGTDTDQDIDAFIATADEFQQRVGILDQQVIEIKKDNWPNPSPEVMTQLTQLQRQKEAIITDIVASLPSRLSAKGVEHLRLHVSERVKKHVKIKAKEGQANAPSVVLLSNDNSIR